MHDKPFLTFTEIFDLWDGTTALARDMGVKVTTADQWRRRRYLHPRWWPRLIEVAEARHQHLITPRQLMLAAGESRGVRSADAEAA
jgi:hypothetical protein